MESLFQDGLFLQVTGITPGRVPSIIAGLLGLISIIIGWLASARLARRLGSGRPMAMVALVLGLTAMLLGIIHLARTTGGFGTGSGRAGAIVAMVIGLIGMILGGRALNRYRRMTMGNKL